MLSSILIFEEFSMYFAQDSQVQKGPCNYAGGQDLFAATPDRL